MPKCNWCGRNVGNSIIVAYWYCSEKCRIEAKGGRATATSGPAGGGPQIDVTPIVNGIVSLFGKLGKKAPAPSAPLPKMPPKPPVASGNVPPKPPVASGNAPPPTVSQLQRLRDDVERRNRAIEEHRRKLADSRSAVRKEIELLKAKRDALLAEKAADDPTGGVPGGPQPAEAASSDILRQIERLGELRSKGILTQREFDDKKAELLRRL